MTSIYPNPDDIFDHLCTVQTRLTGAGYGDGGEAGPDVLATREVEAARELLHTMDQRLVILDEGGEALREYDMTGEMVWSRA